ncbi:MAG TPA: IS110 family transposase [Candidatus Eisenbacteria bacterium]|nr:IS110 family transposase [Candidatus Eisenbacteria bacterium]
MRTMHERCCGLDVHKKTVVACVLTSTTKETRTFGTMTHELLEFVAWLEQERVTHVAMESTGVYWKPVFNLLEGRDFELLVVNARHTKAVPGRKTDVKDAEWLADLLRHGLLRASFVPDRSQRELRELVRYRRTLIHEKTRLITRVQKVLEGANIKLGDVASNVMGLSGRAMLKELAAGNTDSVAMAELALSNLRPKRQRLALALEGTVGAHQRFLLRSQIELIEMMEKQIDAINGEVEERMRPFQPALDLIDQIPGIAQHGAEQIIAEIGIDMSRFPTPAHFASWARVCPGTNESAGKRRQAGTGDGNPWLRSALIEAALGAVRAGRAHPNFFAARYRRLAGRRGPKRAQMAIAHSMLIAIYHMLRDGAHFVDLGPEHWDQRHKESVARRSIRRLEQLGYKVTIEAVA